MSSQLAAGETGRNSKIGRSATGIILSLRLIAGEAGAFTILEAGGCNAEAAQKGMKFGRYIICGVVAFKLVTKQASVAAPGVVYTAELIVGEAWTCMIVVARRYKAAGCVICGIVAFKLVTQQAGEATLGVIYTA